MESAKKEKEGWYPGKYMSRANKRRSVDSVNISTPTENESPSAALRKESPNASKDGNVSTDGILDFSTQSSSISNSEILGSLKVQVVDLKYLRLTSAKLSVQLDKVASQYSAEGFKSIERIFDLYDVTSDIKVSIIGKAENGELLCGIVVVPVTSLLGFSGKPASPKEQWRQFYPICLSRMTDGKAFKFSPGYTELPGYALNRKDPIGFVSIKIDLMLHDHPLWIYLSKGNHSWKRQLSNFSLFDQDGNSDVATSVANLSSNAELCAMINRDTARIAAFFKLPLSVSAVHSLPEVCVLNLFLGCLCFVVDSWQLPFVCVGFCALNGVIFMSQRSYVNTIIWNEPLPLTLVGTAADPNHTSNLPVVMDPLMFLAGAVTTSMNAYPAACAAAAAIMPPPSELFGADGEVGATIAGLSAAQAGSRLSTASSAPSSDRDYETNTRPSMLRLLQTQNVSLSRVSKTLFFAAHTLEVIVNALSFADSRVSIIVYGFLFISACILSIGLYFAPRLSFFVVISFTTMACATGSFVLDMIDTKAANVRTAGARHMQAASHALDCLAGFLSRVPDELELAHRHIAGTSIVNAKGSEMTDAAISFEKRVSLRQ